MDYSPVGGQLPPSSEPSYSRRWWQWGRRSYTKFFSTSIRCMMPYTRICALIYWQDMEWDPGTFNYWGNTEDVLPWWWRRVDTTPHASKFLVGWHRVDPFPPSYSVCPLEYSYGNGSWWWWRNSPYRTASSMQCETWQHSSIPTTASLHQQGIIG